MVNHNPSSLDDIINKQSRLLAHFSQTVDIFPHTVHSFILTAK